VVTPGGADGADGTGGPGPGADSTILPGLDADAWSRLSLAACVAPPADVADAHGLVLEALRDGARVSAAVAGSVVLGLVVSHRADPGSAHEILVVGIAPEHRRAGVAGALLGAHVAALDPDGDDVAAEVTLAERDVVEPLDRPLRASIARRLLERAGFEVGPADASVRSVDPAAIHGRRAAG
jgi:ribosomal protein S18 acetylase RimI-like enzyme